jgi:hypothetical protein
MTGRTSSVRGAIATLAMLLLPLTLFFTSLPSSRAAGLAQRVGARRELVIPSVTTTPPALPPVMTTTTTVPDPDPNDLSPGWEQRWGQAAVARMSYPWAQLGYTVRFLSGRPGLLGKTIPSSKEIEIYVRQGETFDRMRHALAHELGHAVDLSYNNAARRARWRQLRGIDPSTPWFLWNGRDYASPAGDFAETFALWQAGPADYSEMAAPPDGVALAALQPLFYPSA